MDLSKLNRRVMADEPAKPNCRIMGHGPAELEPRTQIQEMNLRHGWRGAVAAFEAAGWIASPRLAELLTFPGDAPAPFVTRREPEGALRVARRTLRILSWLPGHRWRTSCLYESVAECLVLRGAGVPAAVCIGVKRGTDGAPGIEAHAWVARSESDRRFHGFSTMTVLDELRAQR